MLNERQFNLIRDLENTTDLITAETLAQKYHVSLRTIRNDIDEIAYAIQKYDVQFLRIPKVGMRIISKENIHLKLLNEMHSTSFLSLSNTQQDYLLSLMFLLFDNPITLDYLTDFSQVSKVTLNNKLQHCINYLSSFNININSVKHKGNYLIGKAKDINELLINICDNINFNIFKVFIADKYFNKKEIDLINDIINYIATGILFSPTNRDGLFISIAYIIKQTNLYPDNTEDYMQEGTEIALINPNVSNLILYINKKLNIKLSKGYISLLKTVLLKYTDSTALLRKSYDTSDNLEKAVHLMVQEGLRYYPSLLEDASDLEKNLMMHLYYTINRINANLDNKNPLLNKIKKRFADVFNNIMIISKTFTDNYPLVIDENEASYITLYFLNYLEKAKHKKSTNALLVCNSGIGATKLLSTKIKNNFPAINIVNTSSYFDLQTNTADLSNIDIIISTIKLPENVTVPSIIVSPLLDYEDTIKINSILPNHINGTSEYNNNSFLKDLSKTENNNIGLIFSEITVYIYEMLEQLYNCGLPQLISASIVGLISHIFMSIDRWAKHDYIKSTDFDNFKNQYPKEMKIILQFLAKIEKMLKIYIDPIEATAIIRYIINS